MLCHGLTSVEVKCTKADARGADQVQGVRHLVRRTMVARGVPNNSLTQCLRGAEFTILKKM